MTSRQLFESVFPKEITNVEFFGTEDAGISCVLYSPSGQNFSRYKHTDIYDAFKDAYDHYKDQS